MVIEAAAPSLNVIVPAEENRWSRELVKAAAEQQF